MKQGHKEQSIHKLSKMLLSTLIYIVLLPLVLAVPDIYPENPDNIKRLNQRNFDRFLVSTNYTTMVKFYAPWCKYCIQLKSEFEAAAEKAGDYGKFAIVNCDLEENKRLCHEQGVEGFPTLISYAAPKNIKGISYENGKINPKDLMKAVYQGDRSSNGITTYMKNHVKNYTKRIKSLQSLVKFMENDQKLTKALLLTEQSKPDLTLKSVAVEFSREAAEFGWVDSKVVAHPQFDEFMKKQYPFFFDVRTGKIKFPLVIFVRPDGAVTSLHESLTYDKETMIGFMKQEFGLKGVTVNGGVKKATEKPKQKKAKRAKKSSGKDTNRDEL